MKPPKFASSYLVEFALRDLFERTGWATTLAASVTIASAVGFAVLSLGLALGAHDVQVDRRGRDPGNRTLWFGHDASKLMTPARLGELEQSIKIALPPEGLEGIYPFSRTGDDWEWITSDGSSAKNPIGRTLRPDDRFLESYPTDASSPITRLSQGTVGIVASPRMLKMLGYPEPDGSSKTLPPKTLGLRLPNIAEPVRIPLLGVSKKEFPPFIYIDYVIGEMYEAELRRTSPILKLKEFRTGPVPKAWATAADEEKLPEVLENLILTHQGLEYPKILVTADGNFAWILMNGKGDFFDPEISKWKQFLEEIAVKMKEIPDFPAALDIAKSPPEQDVVLPPPLQPIINHQYAAAVVKEAVDLPAAGMAAHAVLIKATREDWAVPRNEGTIAEIIKLIEETSQVLKLLTAFSLGVAVVAIINLLVVEWLRAERKRPEWGMLKAIGMTQSQLSRLGAIEGTILGGFGAAVGIGLSALIGRLVGQIYYGYRSIDADLGFRMPSELVAIPFFVAVVVCSAGTWWANGKARSAAPCESLRLR